MNYLSKEIALLILEREIRQGVDESDAPRFHVSPSIVRWCKFLTLTRAAPLRRCECLQSGFRH